MNAFTQKISWCNVLLMTLLAFILLLPIASAKPQDWTDKGYSFKSIQRVCIQDMDMAGKVNTDIERRNLQQLFQEKAAERLHAAQLVHSDHNMDVYVKASVLNYRVTQRVIPAHQETRYRTEHIHYTEKGQKRTLSYEVPYQVYVPEEIIHTSNVRLRFDVYDAKTNQAIFSRDDTRVDDYSTDLQRTYTKLVTAFYKELDKKISKG
ncbi:MAG: hypothetical protein K6F95_09115 [Selenomonas sp.]|uniref:hypothetical protein n=1 Tax=Selenomonas sp. TaxID=2053611 RepID=UPI0025DFF939|nr:hypothetical protein [Selenomonas sp.]MCR5758051.1 hypothetical protein [Selenomonas sp.]